MKTITTRRGQLAAMGIAALMVGAVVAKTVYTFSEEKGALSLAVGIIVLVLTYVLLLMRSEPLPTRAEVKAQQVSDGPEDPVSRR